MAITHRGYKVYLKSDGQELPQFQVEVLDERTITCWIPSDAGKTFSLHYTKVDSHPFKNMCARLVADGRQLAGHGGPDESGEEDSIDRVYTHGVGDQHFVFSEVILAGGDGDTVPPPSSDTIGVIEAKFWPAVKKMRETQPVRGPQSSIVLKLSERSKLIGMNHVKIGDVIPNTATAGHPSLYRWKPASDEPYAVFRFKHRPASVLQAMGVMPRPTRLPTPPTTSFSRFTPAAQLKIADNVTSKRPLKEEITDVKPTIDNGSLAAKRRRIQAEIAVEEAEAAARQARAALLRAQLEEDDAASRTGPGAVFVKPERPPSPISVPRSGEVIDLTD